MRSSIVVAAHNEGDLLIRTLRSCTDGSEGLEHELIVADDRSTDGSVQEARARFPAARFVGHDRRLGPSPTKDLGARHARGEVLLFLDGHSHPEPAALRRLVEDVEALDGGAVVTPAIAALDVERWENNPRQVGHGYRMTLHDFTCDWVDLRALRRAETGGRELYESPAAIGCAVAVSRHLYEALGGFDPTMRSWGLEDLDFSLRCWLAGHRILHDPHALVGHRFQSTFARYEVPMTDVRVNQLRTARKNFEDTTWERWLEAYRAAHGADAAGRTAWHEVWSRFEADRPNVEEERARLRAGRRRHCESWYARRFDLPWPRCAGEPLPEPAFSPLTGHNPSGSPEPSHSPSPSPEP